MASAWLPPVEPWSPTDKDSFAFKSVAQRWPTILTSAIDGLYQASYALSYASDQQALQPKIDEAKTIVEHLSKLKHDMGRDRPLETIGDDGGDSTHEYDAVVQQNSWTWFTAPWLFAECYLYRLLRSFFARSQHWKQYDPFSAQKVKAFKSSAAAIAQLSDAVEPLLQKAEEVARAGTSSDSSGGDEALKVIFRELVQTSLWGNATDLSLLTHMTHADIQQLQAGGLGAEAQKKREHFVLSGLGGIEKAWDALRFSSSHSSRSRRVDLILDNSGFELYTDLLMADFLIASKVAEKVVIHPKDMPWFVSDVTPADFLYTLEALQSSVFFSPQHGKEEAQKDGHDSRQDLDQSYFQDARGHPVSPEKSYVIDSTNVHATASRPPGASTSQTSTQRLAARWVRCLQSGAFELSMPQTTPLGGTPELAKTTQADFWTSYHNYPSMTKAAPRLFESLSKGSQLVISKGDLNYRKWTSDARWAFDTPFAEVLGPVRGQLNLLVLRTNKADVCVGVPTDRLQGLDEEDAEWRTNGKFAMIEFVRKDATE